MSRRQKQTYAVVYIELLYSNTEIHSVSCLNASTKVCLDVSMVTQVRNEMEDYHNSFNCVT